MTPEQHAQRAKARLVRQFELASGYSMPQYTEIESIVDDIIAAARAPEVEKAIQLRQGYSEPDSNINRLDKAALTVATASNDAMAREIETLRKQRTILVNLVERALCGCFSLDCVKHGAYDVDEIALYRSMKPLRAKL